MSAPTIKPPVEEKSVEAAKPWYEDPVKLRQKREQLGINCANLSRLIGRHPSYVAEIEAGRIRLIWEENAEQLWSCLTELQLSRGKAGSLTNLLTGQRSPADLMDEIKLLREIRQAQNEIIRELKEQSASWEEAATTRAEIIRTLRIELGLDPDVGEEEG